MSTVVQRVFDPNRLFQGASVPPWMSEFAKRPEEALDDLLAGRAYLGHLSPLEPLDLLSGWASAFSADGAFIETLDRALTAWIESHWGNPLLSGSARVAADAWSQVGLLLAGAPLDADGKQRLLANAAARLHERVLADRRFLNGLSEGRGRDPMAAAWYALARHQRDRDLLPEWWRLSQLPADEPWYRGPVAVHGLMHIPPENPAHAGGFDKQLAVVLARLGRAFVQRAGEGWLDEETAREEFQVALQLALRRYPLDNKWQQFWRPLLTGHGDSMLAAWVKELLPTLRIPERHEPGSQWARPDPDWSKKAKKLVPDLKRGDRDSVARAQALLDEQRSYAEQTGDTEFFVLSASNFARSLRHRDPRQALAWVRAAREQDPSDAHAWNIEGSCLKDLALSEPALLPEALTHALTHALAAARRFPGDPVAQNTLAEVLRAAGRLAEAEAVYRETLARGIADANTYTALGEVLKEQGRFDAAQEQYERACKEFPNNPVAHNGLASVFRARGELDEAAERYRAIIDRGIADDATYSSLNKIERELREGVAERTQHKPAAAQPAAKQSHNARPALDRDTIAQITADAFLLRRWARRSGHYSAHLPAAAWRERARTLLERLHDRWQADPEAAEAYALLKETGRRHPDLLAGEATDPGEILALLEEAAKRFPGSARVRYALARAARAANQESALPWRRIARLDRRLEPVEFLGTARHLLQHDPAKGRDALGRLAYWTRHHADGSDTKTDEQAFTRWWSRQLRTALFDGENPTNADELPDDATLLARLAEHADDLDDLEESFVDRHAWA